MSDTYVYTEEKLLSILGPWLTGCKPRDPLAPDPDMPRAKYTNPHSASDGMAEAADVQKAWLKAGLTNKQHYTLSRWLEGDLLQDIGSDMGITGQAVGQANAVAIKKMLDYLNGTD